MTMEVNILESELGTDTVDLYLHLHVHVHCTVHVIVMCSTGIVRVCSRFEFDLQILLDNHPTEVLESVVRCLFQIQFSEVRVLIVCCTFNFAGAICCCTLMIHS